MKIIVGSARSDENGNYRNGKAGDQSGREVSTQEWYEHKKGWDTIRFLDINLSYSFAQVIEDLCNNDCVGYDQSQNTSLWNELKKLKWDWKKLNTNCETDCAQLIRCALKCIGIDTNFFTTANELKELLKTGHFIQLKEDKYTKSSKYLRRGDIQVTKTKGHTITVLTTNTFEELPSKTLKKGDKNKEVKLLQEFLNWYGNYNLVIDGSFGGLTQKALKDFQEKEGIEINGIFNTKTLLKAKELYNG